MPTNTTDQPAAEQPKADPSPGVIPDDQLKAQVDARRKAREKREQPDSEDKSGPDLIRAAADGEELSEGEKLDALEWLLSADEDSFTHVIEVNVGSPTKEKWINWEIRPVDLDTLRRIRKASQGGSRAQQRRAQQTGEMDEVEVNLRIVVEGTVYPDLRSVANDLRLVDPADALKRKFAHKPGLLGQISGEIMSISGYDDEDVREVEAAKNS